MNMIIILGSILNIIWVEGRRHIRSFNQTEDIRFGNEQVNNHMSSENYKVNDYGHDLELALISH